MPSSGSTPAAGDDVRAGIVSGRTEGGPMTTPASGTLDDLLEQLSPEVAALVRAVDDLVHRTDPDVVRVVWPHQRTMGYGVGPKKMSEHYAYVTIHEQHINLGCNHGARLDSGGLLEGTGASMRKLTVRDRKST